VIRGGSIHGTSNLLGQSDISITASNYAHLDLYSVRGELDITKQEMLKFAGLNTPSVQPISKIDSMSNDEKIALLAELQASLGDEL